MHLETHTDPFGIVATFDEVIKGPDIIATLSTVYRRPDFADLKYFLSDRSNVKDMIMTSDEIKTIAKMRCDSIPVNPDLIVVLVSPNDLIYGYSKMFTGLARSRNSLVCKTREEGVRYIQEHLNCNDSNTQPIFVKQ